MCRWIFSFSEFIARRRVCSSEFLATLDTLAFIAVVAIVLLVLLFSGLIAS